MIKILHVIGSLQGGGAQQMLHLLSSAVDRNRFEFRIISLLDLEPFGTKLRSLGVETAALHGPRGPGLPLVLPRLIREIRTFGPDLVHTWNYYANAVGGLAARIAKLPVAWALSYSSFSPEGTRFHTRCAAYAGSLLSWRIPVRILCCSESTRQTHIDRKYRPDRLCVIPNGFDLDVFRPDAEARRAVRAELGIPEDAIVIGRFGRFHPDKDYRNLVEAAGELAARRPGVYFLAAGTDVTWENHRLTAWLNEKGLRDRFRLLGWREDIPRLTAAIDIATSCSCTEAFGIVIGEAMACEVPCVVTDVGDSAWIVADTGLVIRPRDPQALAQAWEQLIDVGPDGRRKLGVAARKRARENFSLPAVVSQYEKFYESIVPQAAGTATARPE